MKTFRSLRNGVALTLVLISTASAQDVKTRAEGGKEPPLLSAQELNAERKASFGVMINKPKVYDDALLRELLTIATGRLAAISGLLDAAKVNGALGAISGGTLSSSGFGVSITTAPSPGVVSTAKGATAGTENSTQAVDTTASQYPGTTLTTVSKATSGAAATDVQTTKPSFPVPSATAPAGSLALPSTFSASASDILNEQVQLLAEIANLRLLLDGALSDQIMQDKTSRVVKRRLTIGIPITLSPTAPSKDRVTVVEAVAWSPEPRIANVAPAVTALLPKDKTYNTVSITDRNFSFSGGAVIGLLGASAAFTKSRKTWYVVAAQDTVAMNLGSVDSGELPAVRFAWQLRPVLGQKYLRAGTRELMVQLAPPTIADKPYPISLNVRTSLRKYDQKSGLVGETIEGSVSRWARYDVPNIELKQFATIDSLEDLGDGNYLVNLAGRFLNGTYVRVGGRKIADGSGLSFEATRLRFQASGAELANLGVLVVSRDGTETPVELSACDVMSPKSVIVEAAGELSTRVRIELTQSPKLGSYVLKIGPSAYRAETSNNLHYAAVIPTDVLKSKPDFYLQGLLRPKCSVAVKVPALAEKPKALELVTISRGPATAAFVLTGDQATSATIAYPTGLNFVKVAGQPTLTLTPPLLSTLQSLVVNLDGKPRNVAVPQPPKPDTPACCPLCCLASGPLVR